MQRFIWTIKRTNRLTRPGRKIISSSVRSQKIDVRR